MLLTLGFCYYVACIPTWATISHVLIEWADMIITAFSFWNTDLNIQWYEANRRK